MSEVWRKDGDAWQKSCRKGTNPVFNKSLTEKDCYDIISKNTYVWNQLSAEEVGSFCFLENHFDTTMRGSAHHEQEIINHTYHHAQLSELDFAGQYPIGASG